MASYMKNYLISVKAKVEERGGIGNNLTPLW